MGEITVHKKGYWRKEYTRKDGTKVKRTWVPATEFKIKDLGAPGRGKKLIEIKGTMKIGGRGYHTSLPVEERHSILRVLVGRYGAAKIWRRLHAMVIMRKREQPQARKIFESDRNWVAETFGTKGLTPRKAIKKWKGMSHKARAKAMPNR